MSMGSIMSMGRAALLVAVALSAAACGDDGSTAEAPTSTAAPTSAPADGPAATTTLGGPSTTGVSPPADPFPGVEGPAPGVDDTSIRIGIAYVDTEALRAINLDYDLGDHAAVYEALVDDINARGGINGRTLEAVVAPVDPTSQAPADELCARLTEDEEVFLITGFWLRDSVLCPLELHGTAVVGGAMNPDRIARAEGPWLTWEPDTDQPREVVRRFAAEGLLDGRVAVFANAGDQEQLDSHVLPTLDELGITPVATGVVTAPPTDQPAVESDVDTIAERFESDGADTVLIVGPSGVEFPRFTVDTGYRPTLLFVNRTAATAFITNAETTDTSILEGSYAGDSYGPAAAQYQEAGMAACIETIEAATDEPVPSPDGFSAEDNDQPWAAAFQACPDMVLVEAWLTAAGRNLNYATLELALEEGLEVAVPGDPTPRSYGPPPAGDGNPAAYLYAYEPGVGDYERIES